MSETLENQIVHRWQGGQSMRGIARELGVSRWRVERTIALNNSARSADAAMPVNAELPKARTNRSSKLDEYIPAIEQMLERYPNMTAVRIFQELKQWGYRVRYTTSAKLLTELTAAFGDRSLPSVVRHYGRYELLIIDEFGFDKLERAENADAPSLLYKIIDNRHGRSSTALVTNIDFEHWTEYLGDAPLAMALIDRAVDGANIQRFAGESYRAHRAEQKAASKSRSANQKASSKTKS